MSQWPECEHVWRLVLCILIETKSWQVELGTVHAFLWRKVLLWSHYMKRCACIHFICHIIGYVNVVKLCFATP